MSQHIARIALVVDDYDGAIEFYTKKLGFSLLEDTILSETKRWVVVAPKGSNECALLLAKAAAEEQRTRIGNQTGGRVFLFLYTDNFQADYQNLIDQRVKIVREPTQESYGRVAVFADLYGNLWDLIEAAQPTGSTQSKFY
jgi:catechol 2,3-dioxygenase-like lactoylglutathione lyase family enzyme